MCLGKILTLVALWFWKHLASHKNCQVPIAKKPVSARQSVSQVLPGSWSSRQPVPQVLGETVGL